MKKQILNAACSSPHLTISSILLLFLLSLIYPKHTHADVVTYSWSENYKGYTLKQIPGSYDFVAGATYYNEFGPTSGPQVITQGYQLLHIGANGSVLNDIKFIPAVSTDVELRVVDIVPLKDKINCWVIMQAKETDPNTNIIRYYIYAEKVDITTGQKSGNLPNDFKISVGPISQHQNVFATSAVQTSNANYDNILYISGYKYDYTITTNSPNEPSHTSLGKVGCMFKITEDPNTQSLIFVRYDFNTADGGVYDYDMANRVKVIPPDNVYTHQETILLVGAANDYSGNAQAMGAGTHGSGVFIARFDPNALPIHIGYKGQNVIYGGPSGRAYPYTVEYSYYGTDVFVLWQSIYILCNRTEDNAQVDWGILRVASDYNTNQDLKIDPSVPCFLQHVNHNNGGDWGKQLFHKGSLHNGKEFMVCGEAIDYPHMNPTCNSYIGSNPSPTNVLPFFANIDLDYTLNGGITGNVQSYIMHNNDLGTTTWPPSYPVDHFTPLMNNTGTMLEDLTRLYSPVCHLKLPYTNNEFRLIAPLTNPTQPSLNAKFIETDVWGSEPDCGKELNGCYTSLVPLNHEQHQAIAWTGFAYLTSGTYNMTKIVDNPIEDRCTNGATYKPAPTNITSIESNEDVSIFPNPTTSELNIKVGDNLNNTTFKFTLTDVTGKNVASREQTLTSSTINIKLPKLSPGVYIGIVEVGNTQHTEKIVIE